MIACDVSPVAMFCYGEVKEEEVDEASYKMRKLLKGVFGSLEQV